VGEFGDGFVMTEVSGASSGSTRRRPSKKSQRGRLGEAETGAVSRWQFRGEKDAAIERSRQGALGDFGSFFPEISGLVDAVFDAARLGGGHASAM